MTYTCNMHKLLWEHRGGKSDFPLVGIGSEKLHGGAVTLEGGRGGLLQVCELVRGWVVQTVRCRQQMRVITMVYLGSCTWSFSPSLDSQGMGAEGHSTHCCVRTYAGDELLRLENNV